MKTVEQTKRKGLSPAEDVALTLLENAIGSDLCLYAGVPSKIRHLYKQVYGSEPPETYEFNAHWSILRGLRTGDAALVEGINQFSTKLIRIINGVHWQHFGNPLYYLNLKILYEYYLALCSYRGLQAEAIDYERFVALRDEHFPSPSIEMPDSDEMPPEPQEGELHIAAAAKAALDAYIVALEMDLIEHRISAESIVFDMIFDYLDDESVFSILHKEYKRALSYVKAQSYMFANQISYRGVQYAYPYGQFSIKPVSQSELKEIIRSVLSWF